MLQFITCSHAKLSPADQIREAIKGGCRWVQIDLPDASDDEIKKLVDEVKPLCEEKGVFLIMAHKVELAKECNVGGVEVSKDDMPPSKARMILGPAAVVGVKVNSLAEILAVSQLDIDYYTIAPFRGEDGENETSLGIEGVRKICFEMEEKEVNIPHVAAGGIKLEDTLSLIEAGVNGLAVSEAIACADDPAAETEKFVAALPKTEDE
ncbi:MAG: thiamine phosphate synthase [Muribaculaceae bacterium]|nr:thiamine phosphate synthase [Muribaculaceae bacterium]